MTKKFRMVVYGPDDVRHQTHDIDAANDYEALATALDMYVGLAKEPNAPDLDRFSLWDDNNQLVSEIRTRDLPQVTRRGD